MSRFIIEFNMPIRNIINFNSFYFVGIGGVSMSALAEYVFLLGKKVGGCDAVSGEYVLKLNNLGIKITSFDEADISGYEVVVYTDAVGENNKVISLAHNHGKAVIARGEFLAAVASMFKSTVAVAGCHGKTTCTAMLAHIFDTAGRPFACHIGGNDAEFGNFHMTGSEYFLTEACEYKKNFLRLNPDVAVVLNSAPDHLECYGSEEELIRCYQRFISKACKSVTLYGDFNADGVTFGLDHRADYSGGEICAEGGKFSFTVFRNDKKIARIKLGLYGKHNVLNALAAFAAADICGLEPGKIVDGIESFRGVKRRFEYMGTYNGAACIADYAHHPDEIKVALKTARTISDGNVYVVFQPHTYSRTKILFSRFIAVLNPLKRLLVYKTFAAREYYDDAGSAYTLSLALKKSRYGDEPRDIKKFLKSAGEGDTVLFLGAGDIYDIAKMIIKSQYSDCF